MELKNANAIVTGVSKGIGLATTIALLSKGVKVAGWSRTMPPLEHKNFAFFKTDVGDVRAVEESYKATVKKLGKNIDILINNAGFAMAGKIEEMPVEDWRSMFETNVNGIFYCSRLVIPQMKENDSGHIINISSVLGTIGKEEMVCYSGTKHAVRGISHSLYKELRSFGIKVTCIYPGSVKTNFYDNIDIAQANDNMMMPEDIAGAIIHALESQPNYSFCSI